MIRLTLPYHETRHVIIEKYKIYYVLTDEYGILIENCNIKKKFKIGSASCSMCENLIFYYNNEGYLSCRKFLTSTLKNI